MKKKIINRNKEKSIQNIRFYIQLFFTLICIWIGVEFYFFVKYLESDGKGMFLSRPPGVDSFLPISSLMNLYYFLSTGEIHSAHPAGLFIFIAIIIVSFVFGKSFCSWICPVGFLSELIGDFGDKITKKLFKRKLHLPKFLDFPLRTLKYLLLGFFIYSIFFLMGVSATKLFLDGSYNLIADVKMYYFFADISRFSLIVIGSLLVLSIFIRNFWCRYLCPYGALLGLISLFSPNKIKRNPISCIDCGLCTKACPSSIKVDKVKIVISDECSTCMNCVDACPVADTLQLETIYPRKKINKKLIAIAIVAIYFFVIGVGYFTGNWQNNISTKEYLELYKNKDKLDHFSNTEDIKNFNSKIKNDN